MYSVQKYVDCCFKPFQTPCSEDVVNKPLIEHDAVTIMFVEIAVVKLYLKRNVVTLDVYVVLVYGRSPHGAGGGGSDRPDHAALLPVRGHRQHRLAHGVQRAS